MLKTLPYHSYRIVLGMFCQKVVDKKVSTDNNVQKTEQSTAYVAPSAKWNENSQSDVASPRHHTNHCWDFLSYRRAWIADWSGRKSQWTVPMARKQPRGNSHSAEKVKTFLLLHLGDLTNYFGFISPLGKSWALTRKTCWCRKIHSSTSQILW
jgi:hypothetical protein